MYILESLPQYQNWIQKSLRLNIHQNYICAQSFIPPSDESVEYSGRTRLILCLLITRVSNVGSTVCSGGDQRKHDQSSTSLAFVRGIHWWPVDSPHKGPVMRKMFPFDDIIMECRMNESLSMRGKISTTCTISALRNLRNFKEIFMFS